MPKALRCHAFGPPEDLVFEEIEAPTPAPSQVVVSVRAVAVNFPDTLIIQGAYQFKPAFPFSPGAEIAGVVKQVGVDVALVVAGQRVFAQMPLPYGGYAEEVALQADALTPMSDDLEFDVAAAFGAAYGTAFHALKERANLRSGETVLVLGASGGVGLAAVELAAKMGARVIAAASSADKLALCRHYGATELIDYESEDLRARLNAITGGRGVDVVLDPVGGRWSEPALRSCAWNGRYLVVGFASGEIPRPPANLVLLKGCSMVGVFYSGFAKHEPAACKAGMAQLAAWVQSGELRPLISARFPLADGAKALRLIASRQVTGKVVLLA